ncbi:MAG: glycosyltransferase family 4 protein [Rhodospirillaceae bacterium]
MTPAETASPSSDTPPVPGTKAPAVLQVLPSLSTGGVERGTVDIATALTEAGRGAVVASAGGPMAREIERANAVHVTLPLDSKNPLVMRRNVAALETVIREHGIAIVHARSRAPAWSARAAARRCGVPFVTTFHGTYNFGNPFKKAYNAVMASGDIVIAISDFIGRHVTETYGTAPEKVRVIPRGIDLETFNPDAVSPERMIQLAQSWRLPDGAPVIMLPGRLTRWKGQAVLIEAARRLGRPDVRVLLVGDDQGRAAYREELEDLIGRIGAEGIVHLTGPCRDMAAAYMLADVVVSASTDPEGFGRVAAEAQAMGRPVIATDHGGARETVIAGETGWLVPPGDADALARALRAALTMSNEDRDAVARRAIAHIRKNFTRAEMCRATLAVYDELLDAAGRR